MIFEPKVLAPEPGTRAKVTFRWLQTQFTLGGSCIFKPPDVPEVMTMTRINNLFTGRLASITGNEGFFQKKAFQVVALGKGKKDGVIRALAPLLDNAKGGPGILGAISQDVQEPGFRKVERAGGSHQNSPRLQETDAPQIQLLVAPRGSGHIPPALGESGRVEVDPVVLASPLHLFLQKVKDVFPPELNVRQAVEPGIFRRLLYRFLGGVDADHPLGGTGRMEGEESLVAKGVEDRSAKVPACLEAILPLVQVSPGLVARPWDDPVANVSLMNFDLSGKFAHEHLLLLGESFQTPDRKVIAENDGLRLEQLVEEGGKERGQLVGPLGEGLHHQMVPVPVDDQGGNSVRFPVHEPIGIGVLHDRLPKLGCPLEYSFPEIPVDRIATPGDQAKSDLRAITVKTLSEKLPIPPLEGNDAARGRILNSLQVVAEDPGMALLEPGETFGCESEKTHK